MRATVIVIALVCAARTIDALRFLQPEATLTSFAWPLHFDTVDDALRSNPFFQTLREALKVRHLLSPPDTRTCPACMHAQPRECS